MSIRVKIFTAIAGLTLVAVLAPVSAIAYTGIPADFTFTRNLPVGTVNSDVPYLKVVLIAEGCGTGISNTTYYGPNTKANVQCFQNKYKSAISAFAGYTIAATGLVGTGTRAQLNVLIGGATPPPVTGGGLSVGLAYDTPASTSVIDATNANFTKFSLTAGATDVSVSKIYVTRGGLSANATIENVKIIDIATGGYKGSVGSLNVDNRAMITFSPALVIPAGTTKTYFIRAGIVDGQGSGSVVTMGIASNSDIVSNASTVTGAPVTGNGMTVVLLTVGSLTLTETAGLSDSTPDVGETNVPISTFTLSGGTTESVTVESITVLKAGTADVTDVANIELYDVTHNVSLGTAASWDSEEKATWGNLNLLVDKGATLRLKVMVDIVGGVASTAKTVYCDVVDGSDELISARGNVYGAYITLTNSWDGLGTIQTINAGALNIAKASTTPAAGKVSPGNDVPLAVFDFDAKGEEMRITAATFNFTIATVTIAQITNIKVYDENGTIVAGPKDLAGTTPDGTVAFTDTFIVPVGIHKYTVKAKIADATTGGTILVAVDDPYTSITAKGMTSGDSILPTPNGTDPAGNTLTISVGDLNLVTLTTPIARFVTKGANDFLWATVSLSAADSGEDIQVTSISPYITVSALAKGSDIDNAELWADLTTANSARGDVYETKVSDTTNLTGAADADALTAFPLTQTITVAKGSFVNVALIADLAAAATGTALTDTIQFHFDDAVCVGASSGQTVTADDAGATVGSVMTIAANGALTITKDSSSPVTDIVVAGETPTLAVFRLAASNVESLDVDDLTVTITGGTNVDTFYLYNGTTLLATATGSAAPKFTLTDGALTVPANGYVRVTLKAKMNAKAQVSNNVDVTASLAGGHVADSVNCTGLASGAAVDSDAQVALGSTMDLYQTKPTFAAVTSRTGYSLSGDLIPSTAQLVAIFDVTANASEDVTFEQAIGKLIVGISRVQDSDNVANTWLLKDQDGTLLDSNAAVADTATSVTFDFTTAGLTVPAGTTKSFFIYADTTEFEDNGDVIQVYLDDTSTNIEWSVNGDSTDYYDADKIFRNDIYAGAFVNPS